MPAIAFEKVGVAEVVKNPRFKFLTHKTKYFVNVDTDCYNYEEELLELLKKSVKSAVDEVEKDGNVPYRISLSINSALIDNPIYTGFILANDFEAERILTKFSKVQQSANTPSLLGEPFYVEIAISTSLSGQMRPSGESKLNHDTGVFEIVNLDNRCFILSALISNLKNTTSSAKNRMRIAKNISRQTACAKRKYIDDLVLFCREPLKNPHCTVHQLAPFVEAFFNLQYPENQPHQIVVFATRNFSEEWIYPPEQAVCAPTILPIYLNNRHYDPIWYPTTFFGTKYMCYACHKSFSDTVKHSSKCIRKCLLCMRSGKGFPCKWDNTKTYCDLCNTTFPNTACYNTHLKRMCKNFKTCQTCFKHFSTQKEKNHECGSSYCYKCHIYHKPGKSCYVQAINTPLKEPVYKLIVYDFETSQHISTDKGFKHHVNFAAAKLLCNKCMNSGAFITHGSCTECSGVFKYWSTPEDASCEPAKEFWKFICKNTLPTKTTVVVGHYSGRFDTLLLMEEILRENANHNIRMTSVGNKVYSMKIEGGGEFGTIRFIDSFNHLPVSLDKMIDTLGLQNVVQEKGMFPHLFNCPQNYNHIGQRLPDPAYYMYDSMLPPKRDKFLEWYTKNERTRFDFNNELRRYCENDVLILTHSLVKLREQCREVTGCPTDDILFHCSTLASACMRDYRMTCMPPGSIAIIPENGYGRFVNQSKIALKMLRYLQAINGYNLQYRDSVDGEKLIKVVVDGKERTYSVDGFVDKSPHKSLVIEIMGCYYHGCPTCFAWPHIVMPRGLSQSELYTSTVKRIKSIEDAGYEVVVYWECDIMKRLETNSGMRKFFDDEINNPGPLILRDAFFGGRTGPSRLYCKLEQGRKITYADFSSLYPYVLTEFPMPYGVPERIIGSGTVYWDNSTFVEHDGVYKVLVLAPQNLEIPVIPVRIEKNLLFILCFKCAKDNCNVNFAKNLDCKHTPEERQFVANVTSLELRLALDRGYKVLRYYEMYKCQTSKNIFREYVMKNLKTKIEASGPPPECQTEEDKQRYCDEVTRRYGFSINRDEWTRNPGKRSIAKLRLNALWGKFGQRSNLTSVEICRKPSHFHKILRDYGNNITKVVVVNDKVAFVSVKKKDGFAEEFDYSNILLPIFTTSAARVHLYKSMEKCQGDAKLLYTDTDSIIVEHAKDILPVDVGSFLGDLEIEYPDKNITEFVSGGAKQYGLELQDLQYPGNIGYELKLRGLTLTHETRKSLNYQVLKYMVLNLGRSQPVWAITQRLQPYLHDGVYTISGKKKYEPVFKKGYLDPSRQALVPFGFKTV